MYLRDLSIAIGYEKGTLDRRWNAGEVTFDMADAVLCKVWCSDAWRNDDELRAIYLAVDLGQPPGPPCLGEQRRCAAKGCSNCFTPNSNRQLYCCQNCGQRERYRRRNPRERYGTRHDTCPNGHDRSPENMRLRADGTYACRVCNRERMQQRYAEDALFREGQVRKARLRRLKEKAAAA